MSGKLQVKCEGAGVLPLDQILDFQWGLKKSSGQQKQRLRDSLIKYGITFPVYVWANDGKFFDIDGHRRTMVLREMKEDGWDIPDIPVVYIFAEDEKEAHEKTLLASSKYGDITPEGLIEFLGNSDLDLEDVEDVVEFPDFEMNAFRKEMYAEAGVGTGEADDDGVVDDGTEVPNMELFPAEHHDYIVLLFEDYSDFMYAAEKLGIRKVNYSTIPEKKRVGVGRVVNGKKFVSDILAKLPE